MESSVCHWFNIGLRNKFLFFFLLDLCFFVSFGFMGIFLVKSDKNWVSGALQFFSASYYQFTDDTKFRSTETAVVIIFILLLVHLFRTIYRIFIAALRSS